MDLLTFISLSKSLVFFFCFLFPGFVLVPKGLTLWEQWKKTKRPVLLSSAVTCFMGAIFFYIAALLITVRTFLGVA